MKKTVKNKIKKGSSVPHLRNRNAGFLFLLIIVPFILYSRVINYSFSNLDDASLITDHYDTISNMNNVTKALTTDAFFGHQTSFYRPLQTISFMIDSQISGQNPSAYHFTNLLLFILIVICLFIFLNKTGIKKEVSFLIALLYSVHPMLTNAVCWIPAQGDLFLTLFGLLSFITFINYCINKKSIYLLLHFLCFLLACFAKETAIIFPLMLLLYFYYFLKKQGSWNKIIPFILTWIPIAIIYVSFRNSAITINNPSSISGVSAFIKNMPAIPITYGKLFLPQGLTTMPLFDNLSLVIGLFLLIITGGMIYKYREYNNPYLVFGIVWFIAFTLPPLYYRMRQAEFCSEYFEHRVGLPIIGLIIIFGVYLNSLKPLFYKKCLYVYFLIFLTFLILSYLHSNDYKDRMSFSSAAIRSNPTNAYALNSRGCVYLNDGNINQSLADFENSIIICPMYSSPYFNEGVINHMSGNPQKAEYYYSLALKYDTLLQGAGYINYSVYYNLAWEKMSLKKYNEAIYLLKKAVTEYKYSGDIYNNLGTSYFSTSRYDSAIYFYSKALECQPNTALYWANRGGVKFFTKDYMGALSDYNKSLEIDPNSVNSWYNIGNTKLNIQDYEGAIASYNKVITMDPENGEAFYHRGLAFTKINKTSDANIDFIKAKELGIQNNKYETNY